MQNERLAAVSNTKDGETQTMSVVVSPSPLSLLKAFFNKNRMLSTDAINLAYRSIRGFKYDVKLFNQDKEIVCNVKVTAGRHISSITDLSEVSGVGSSEYLAKVNAFELFVSNVEMFPE